MYSKKSVGPRMDPWGTSALTGYSCEEFPSRTTRNHLLLRKEEIRPNIWPEIPWLKFVKKTSMPNPVKSLGYIKCYNSSSPRPVKSPSNSIRYNYEKICSWSRRPKTYEKLFANSKSFSSESMTNHETIFNKCKER